MDYSGMKQKMKSLTEHQNKIPDAVKLHPQTYIYDPIQIPFMVYLALACWKWENVYFQWKKHCDHLVEMFSWMLTSPWGFGVGVCQCGFRGIFNFLLSTKQICLWYGKIYPSRAKIILIRTLNETFSYLEFTISYPIALGRQSLIKKRDLSPGKL